MTKKIACCVLLLAAAVYNTAPATAMSIKELGVNIDRDLSLEIEKMPLSELDAMREATPPTENIERNIFARGKIDAMPYFARRALFKNYARFLNEWLEETDFKRILRKYEKYSRLDIRFGTQETHRSSPQPEHKTPHDVLLDAQMIMQPSDNNDFHLGLKYDPQGIDAERFNNFTALIEHDFAWLRGEVRYSNVNNFSLILQKNSKTSENFLDLLLEYKYADNRLYADIVYKLGRDWRLKLFGSYSPTRKNNIFMAIFVPL